MISAENRVSIGAALAAARTARGISLEQIHTDLRISVRIMEALERGDHSVFLAPVYARGTVRRLGVYLGMDHNELARLFLEPVEPPVPAFSTEPARSRRAHGMPFWGALIVLVVAGWVVFVLLHRREPVRSAEPSPLAVPVAASATGQTASADPLQLVVTGVSRTWVRVTTDDAVVFENFIDPGQQHAWTARRTMLLRVGYVEGVTAKLNDQPVDLRAGALGNVNTLVFSAEDGKLPSRT